MSLSGGWQQGTRLMVSTWGGGGERRGVRGRGAAPGACMQRQPRSHLAYTRHAAADPPRVPPPTRTPAPRLVVQSWGLGRTTPGPVVPWSFQSQSWPTWEPSRRFVCVGWLGGWEGLGGVCVLACSCASPLPPHPTPPPHQPPSPPPHHPPSPPPHHPPSPPHHHDHPPTHPWVPRRCRRCLSSSVTAWPSSWCSDKGTSHACWTCSG